jgi:hypothetical protein
VRVWLSDESLLKDLRAELERLCPTLDVDLMFEYEGSQPVEVLIAGDWKTITAEAFLRRLSLPDRVSHIGFDRTVELYQNLERLIVEDDGTVVGRGCIYPEVVGGRATEFVNLHAGMVTVGGFRSVLLDGIIGVLVGSSTRASRDSAIPDVTPASISNWATGQAQQIAVVESRPAVKFDVAMMVRALGGDTMDLPICWTVQRKPVSARELCASSDQESWGLVHEFSMQNLRAKHHNLCFREGFLTFRRELPVFSKIPAADLSGWPYVQMGPERPWEERNLFAAILESLARAWEVTPVELAAQLKAQEDALPTLTVADDTDGEVTIEGFRLRKPDPQDRPN